MGSKGSAPAPPDYTAAAKATAKGNLDLAKYVTKANRINTTSPYGTVNYTENADGTWDEVTKLSDAQQKIFDNTNMLGQSLSGTASDIASQGDIGKWNDSLITPLSSTYNATTDTNNAANILKQRLLPEQQRETSALQSQLASQGISPGSEAYETAMSTLNQKHNDALMQAELQGIGLGMKQQGQTYNQSLSSQQQGQNLNNYYGTRNANLVNALRNGTQVTNPTTSNAAQMSNVAGPDLMSAANATYQSQLDNYNAQQASYNDTINALIGVGATYLLSDRRLKINIKKVGTLDNGLSVYTYQYLTGGPYHMGVMAQELAEINPEAVHEDANGFLAVDYSSMK